MKKRFPTILLTAGVLGLSALAAFTLPASAAPRYRCTLPDGTAKEVEVPIAGAGVVCTEIGPPSPPRPTPPPSATPDRPGPGRELTPRSDPPTIPGGKPQPQTEKKGKAKRPKRDRGEEAGPDDARPQDEGARKKSRRKRARRTRLRRRDGSPTVQNPSFMDALPGPSYATGVPNFVIRKFRVPVFLLSILLEPQPAGAGAPLRRA